MLIHGNVLEAWAWAPQPGIRALQYRVSLSSVITYGIRQGLFSSEADVLGTFRT